MKKVLSATNSSALNSYVKSQMDSLPGKCIFVDDETSLMEKVISDTFDAVILKTGFSFTDDLSLINQIVKKSKVKKTQIALLVDRPPPSFLDSPNVSFVPIPFESADTLLNAVKNITEQRTKILLVDDSKVFRKTLSRMLEDTYTVLLAKDGLEATEILSDISVDMIIADLEMPTMNGIELTTYVRQEMKITQIPILLVSSSADTSLIEQGYDAGITTFIPKPIDTKTFQNTVAKLVGSI
jgi:CheY-like chemotaxis protein